MSAIPPTQPPGYYLESHGGALMSLVLGMLGVMSLPLLGPVAWVVGNNALAEIDRDPARYSNRQHAVIGRVLGMVGTGILVLVVVLLVGMVLLFVALGTGLFVGTA